MAPGGKVFQAMALGLAILLVATVTFMTMEEEVLEQGIDVVDLLDLDKYVESATLMQSAATTRERVFAEFNLPEDTTFSSMEDFQQRIGHQCPPLRHCGHKIMQDHLFFLGGGKWSDPDVSPAHFSPYPCWMYHFKGTEPWVDAMIDAGHMALMMDVGDGERYEFDGRFMRLQANLLRSTQDEIDLQARIESLVENYSTSVTRLTIIVDWHETFANASAAFEVGRALARIAKRLPLDYTEILWVNEAFRAASSDADIDSNEHINTALQRLSTPDLQFIKLENEAPPSRGFRTRVRKSSSLDAQSVISLSKDARSKILLVNVGTKREAVAFGNVGALHFDPARAVQGWVPNVHMETDIVLAGRGADRVQSRLSAFGFTRVWTAQGPGLEDAAQRLQSEDRLIDLTSTNVLLGGLDVFSPSLASPSGASPRAFAQTFFQNAVWNVMLRKYIVRASAKQGDAHICSQASDCSTCIPLLGKIPSTRVSSKLLLEYMRRRNVPNKIEILEDEHVWDGTWQSLVEENGDAKIKVRSNYLSTTTRVQQYVLLRDYLRDVNIYGSDSPPTGTKSPDDLPMYAGNNHLSAKDMDRFSFRYPHWIPKSQLQRPSMWLGPTKSKSPIHVDHDNGGNLAYQVIGSKSWVLFPPAADPLMYLHHVKTATTVWSALDDPWAYYSSEKVMRSYPDFQFAFCLSVPVHLGPGEMLFNPSGWWHAVQNLEDSLMINFWIKP
ncbi:Bifunctional arginine demethylase and lysyl-hydroxylase psr-1 [Hondaea fermentalgiana]|uniref:Bifunctional arginine demethylase and lysyl-hydroxylase psr-1 n=1 Tax=Hondaea fermentalgiana TaxID=2315210 RepID=A0A2R5G2E9_9STRA|nr:Bifunctional arginine demethylase and lysyl-hydroxylase psr-1 [Hondaea fermentalgiana]|eukprot:GBG25196.1 Bifunctional arginine demethylase and lysyl-hydroxylase psr-1 [Hondaea fermentalgiana]